MSCWVHFGILNPYIPAVANSNALVPVFPVSCGFPFTDSAFSWSCFLPNSRFWPLAWLPDSSVLMSNPGTRPLFCPDYASALCLELSHKGSPPVISASHRVRDTTKLVKWKDIRPRKRRQQWQQIGGGELRPRKPGPPKGNCVIMYKCVIMWSLENCYFTVLGDCPPLYNWFVSFCLFSALAYW